MSSTRKADIHPAAARLAAVAETAKKRRPAPAKVIQLPLWPEPKRGAPNTVLRGALFAAVQGKGRIAMERAILAAQDGITIRYTGWQLTQSDLDVWEQALHLARTQALGTRCRFTEKGFLQALGRQSGKSGRDWLRAALARLTATAVEISDGRRTYGGSLMDFYRDDDTGRTVLEINTKLAPFFGRSQWTQIDWEQRQRLRGKPLALWLHGFYATHAAPHALKVEYLAQAQRQPDQAAPKVQAESDPSAAESRSRRRDSRLRDSGRPGSCPDRAEPEPAASLGRGEAAAKWQTEVGGIRGTLRGHPRYA